MEITSTNEVALLGVSIDDKLTFKNDIDELCRKAPYELHSITPFLIKEKSMLLANAFINCQFLYTCLIWNGCLLLNIQLTKSAKFISGHSKLFIKNTFILWL